MIVTDKEYSLSKLLVRRLDLAIERCLKHNLDSLFIVDGDEGTGKTTLSINAAYYVGWKSGMPFGSSHVFFDVDKMIAKASKSKNSIFIWDEAALSGLSSEWYNKSQLKLIKFLIVSRKLGNFYFFNVPRIFSLKEYLSYDRSIGLMHTYSRDRLHKGTFTYHSKSAKDALYSEWKRTKKKNYFKFTTFSSRFSNAAETKQLINMEDYNKEKDKIIAELGVLEKPKENLREKKLDEFKWKLAQLKGEPRKEVARALGISVRSIQRWGEEPPVQVMTASRDGNITFNG